MPDICHRFPKTITRSPEMTLNVVQSLIILGENAKLYSTFILMQVSWLKGSPEETTGMAEAVQSSTQVEEYLRQEVESDVKDVSSLVFARASAGGR